MKAKQLGISVLIIILCQACAGTIDRDDKGYNPLSECVVTSSVQPGSEAVIQWNGFTDYAKIFLQDASGTKTPVLIKVITPSGLIFDAPYGLAAGIYRVILEQDGTVDIGQIEILASDLPVSGISMPDNVAPGDILVITGIGFDSAEFSIYLKSQTDRIELECRSSSTGLETEIPSEIPTGRYALHMTDGTDDWILNDSLGIHIRKKLLRVTRIEPYDGTMNHESSYTVEYAENQIEAITYRTVVTDADGSYEQQIFDRYLLGEDGTFRIEGGESSSNNFNFGYVRDSEGRILSADVLRYSKNNPAGTMRQFKWVYDSEGRPTDVTFELDGVTRSIQFYLYESGNLIETNASSFIYEDETSVNNPFAADAAHAYDMMANTMEPFLYAPFLCGEHPFVSRLLPNGFRMVTGPTTTKTVLFEYNFDNEGYVSQMSWDSGASRIVFDYFIQ